MIDPATWAYKRGNLEDMRDEWAANKHGNGRSLPLWLADELAALRREYERLEASIAQAQSASAKDGDEIG